MRLMGYEFAGGGYGTNIEGNYIIVKELDSGEFFLA
jgi:hypothetical protein